MNRSKWLAVWCAVAAVGGVIAFAELEASAYNLYFTKDGAHPLRWWRRELLEFHISKVAPEEGDEAAIQGFVESAFDRWIDTECGTVQDVTSGGTKPDTHATTPTSLRTPPDNLIVFIRSSAEWTRFGNSPTWIAITKIAHDPTTGEIVDADVEINDGGYEFSYDDTPGNNEVDFLSMLTHELGHFFGLDHSQEAEATMFATYATSTADAMEARTLHDDDVNGVCALYTNVLIAGPPIRIEPVPEHKEPSSGGDDCSAGGAVGLWGLALLFLRRLVRRKTEPVA